MVIHTDQLLVDNLARLEAGVEVVLDVEVRGAVAVGAQQHPRPRLARRQQLLHGVPKGEGLAGPVRSAIQSRVITS